jgi:hypothetical protein
MTLEHYTIPCKPDGARQLPRVRNTCEQMNVPVKSARDRLRSAVASDRRAVHGLARQKKVTARECLPAAVSSPSYPHSTLAVGATRMIGTAHDAVL